MSILVIQKLKSTLAICCGALAHFKIEHAKEQNSHFIRSVRTLLKSLL